MNHQDIMNMLATAFMEVAHSKIPRVIGDRSLQPEMVRFAELVAAHVRAEATAAEREACAKVAEGFEQNRDWVRGSLYESIRNEVAAKIRARGGVAS